MCLAPKAPQQQTQPVTPAAAAPLAPESPDPTAQNPRVLANARKSLRIDLNAPTGGSGLSIPM